MSNAKVKQRPYIYFTRAQAEYLTRYLAGRRSVADFIQLLMEEYFGADWPKARGYLRRELIRRLSA